MAEVPTLTSPLLSALPGVRHAFFTRRGGVSEGLYASLNAGPGSGDDRDAVAENRRRASEALGAQAEALVTVYQVHSAIALTADRAWRPFAPQGDAVVTRRPGLLCGALAADCAPVLIADAEARVVAAVHAGWRGALAGVIASAVREMAPLGARPERMRAVVGPCIGPASYEVGLEFEAAFLAAEAANARFFAPATRPEKRLFDLPAFALARLAEVGVAQAEWIGRDTYAEPDHFFSNRRSVHRGETDYGRLLSGIMLED